MRDIFDLDFEIVLNREFCFGQSGPVCTKSFSLVNKITSSTIHVSKDLSVSRYFFIFHTALNTSDLMSWNTIVIINFRLFIINIYIKLKYISL